MWFLWKPYFVNCYPKIWTKVSAKKICDECISGEDRTWDLGRVKPLGTLSKLTRRPRGGGHIQISIQLRVVDVKGRLNSLGLWVLLNRNLLVDRRLSAAASVCLRSLLTYLCADLAVDWSRIIVEELILQINLSFFMAFCQKVTKIGLTLSQFTSVVFISKIGSMPSLWCLLSTNS